MTDAYIYTKAMVEDGLHLNSKMYVHSVVSFLVEVILDLLELKLNGSGNGDGNQGGVSSDDSSTSPFNTHPVMILLGVLWLLLYSWVALAASTTAKATSSSLPTSDSPSNRAVAASDLSAATIFPSASSPAPAATSTKIAVAETPFSTASATASCPSSSALATSSNTLSSSAKMAVSETPLSSASATASCSLSPAQATSSNSLSSAVAETVLSLASDTASCSSLAATSNPSLLAQRDAPVVIMIPTSSPTVAVSATSSSWISMILGKISYPASKLIAKIKCRPEQLMLMFATMAISTFGCLLFPTSAKYHVLYTFYALIIGFNAIFLCLLPR